MLPAILTLGLRTSLEKGDSYQYKEIPPLTTILIPTYNEELYIRPCLKSIINQPLIKNYRNRFEFVLVDSKSSDKTVEVARPLVDRIIKAPKGKLSAKDLGIRASRGDVVVSVDADMYFPLGWIDKMLRHYLNPEVVGVGGIYILSFLKGKGICLETLSAPFYAFTFRGQMIGGNSSFTRKAYLKCGGYNLKRNQLAREAFGIEEEWLFPKRLSKVGMVVFDSSVIGYHYPRRMFPIDSQYTAQIKSGVRF